MRYETAKLFLEYFELEEQPEFKGIFLNNQQKPLYCFELNSVEFLYVIYDIHRRKDGTVIVYTRCQQRKNSKALLTEIVRIVLRIFIVSSVSENLSKMTI